MDAGCVEQRLDALMAAAFDSDESVRRQVAVSLCELGRQCPELALTSCRAFLSSGSGRLAPGHRLALLQSMALIAGETAERIERPLAREAIAAAAEAMTRLDEASLRCQEAGSNLLVALGRGFVDEVLEEMLGKFRPGARPHPMIIRTLANLSRTNVYSVVPHLPLVLTALFPAFGPTKENNWASTLTSALSLFSKSILEYLAHLDQAPDPTLSKETFSQPISRAYKDHLLVWLQQKDAKLRTAALEALVHVAPLLPGERLEEELPKLVPQVLALYRKLPERLPVTRCLHSVLGAAVAMGSRSLKGQVDQLLGALHSQLCAPVGSDDQPGLKNRGQILGCFSLLAQLWPQQTAQFLLRKLASGSRLSRAAGLLALKRLLDTVPLQMQGKKHQIMAAVKMALPDESHAVKKALLQTMGSLANCGFLELAGGKAMVGYVVRLCAVSGEGATAGTRLPNADEATGEDLSAMAEALVEQLAAMEQTADVLWPALMQFLTPAPYAHALPVVCRCLEKVASDKRQSGTLDCAEAGPGLPSPQALLARLLTVSSAPYRGRGRGVPALKLLLVLSPAIHPAVEGLWEAELPELVEHLRGNSACSMVQEHWEEKLVLFLSRTLEAIAEERWNALLSRELFQQVSQLPNSPQERGFLYQCGGLVLRQTRSKAAVRARLQEVLQSVQYHEDSEREGAALGIGLCAAAHLDDTLSRLEDFARRQLAKHAESLLGAVRERPDSEAERVRGALILCYGHVARRAPAERLLPRVDADILGPVLALYKARAPGLKAQSRDLTVKLSLAKALTLVAQTILANGPRLTCSCPRKAELLACLRELIEAEPTDQIETPVRLSAMSACTYLVQLDPPSSEAEAFQLTRTCVDSVLGLLPTESQAGREDHWAERPHLLSQTTAALQDLLQQLLLQDLSPVGLQAVFQHLEGWIASRKDHERQRAMVLTCKLLVFFLENLNVRMVVTGYNLEAVIGRLIPRCVDPLIVIRQLAIESVHALLYVQLRYEGFPVDHRDGSLERLKTMKESLDQVDEGSQLRRCLGVARTVWEHLSHHQLRNLLLALCEGLTDPQPDCASAAAAVLNALLRERGAALRDRAAETLRALDGQLRRLGREHVRLAVVRNICVLASQNTAAVVSLLLAHPVPFDQHTRDIWKALAGDTRIGQSTLELLLVELNMMLELEEGNESSVSLRESGHAPLKTMAAACALSEVLSNPESALAIESLYPRLFGTLLILCSHACKPSEHLLCKSAPAERRASVDATSSGNVDSCDYLAMLKVLLIQGKGQEAVDLMEELGGWEMMEDPDMHQDGVALLAEAMASHASPYLDRVIEYLSIVLNIYKNQRIAVAAFLGEMVKHHVAFDLTRMDILVSSLLRCLLDRSPTIRFLSIRGLGNVAVGDPAKTRRYATKLLAAIFAVMQGADEPHDCITMEGLSGLAKILAQLEENNVRDILVNLGLGIRPFFENRSDRVRAAALAVFGDMSKFAVGESTPVFAEQVRSGLVSLLLHLNDSSLEVTEASKRALASVGPFLDSENLRATFQSESPRDANHDYWAFLSKLTRTIVGDLPDNVNTYLSSSVHFCSNWSPEIRANAVIFTGLLLKNMAKENIQFLADDDIQEVIMLTIRDPAPSVRMMAAKTLSLFC